MAMNQPLSDELEAKAQELAGRIRKRADDDILALARLLVSKEDSEIFGDTEFEVRDIVHRIGAEAFEERLKKKWLRIIGRRVPAVSSKRQVPRVSNQKTARFNGSVRVLPGLLLLW